MNMMHEIRFSLSEILALIGLVQCVFLLVYIGFRAKQFIYAFWPFLYFLVIGLIFLADFARGYIADVFPFYELAVSFLWLYTIPLSVFVIFSMTKQNSVIPAKYYGIFSLPVIAFLAARAASFLGGGCEADIFNCPDFYSWFALTGIMASAFSMLSLWLDDGALKDVRRQKMGRERYWVALTIIISNIFSVILMFALLGGHIPFDDIVQIRTLLGLAFVYLVTTSLFRLYPYLTGVQSEKNIHVQMSKEEEELVQRIEALLHLDKVYHESGFGRADLARELQAPEVAVSKIINLRFGKNLPQLLNEYRVEDAKLLLMQTDENIGVVAQEVGFNSIATFNRVFKELENLSPSQFREQYRKEIMNKSS